MVEGLLVESLGSGGLGEPGAPNRTLAEGSGLPKPQDEKRSV